MRDGHIFPILLPGLPLKTREAFLFLPKPKGLVLCDPVPAHFSFADWVRILVLEKCFATFKGVNCTYKFNHLIQLRTKSSLL